MPRFGQNILAPFLFFFGFGTSFGQAENNISVYISTRPKFVMKKWAFGNKKHLARILAWCDPTNNTQKLNERPDLNQARPAIWSLYLVCGKENNSFYTLFNIKFKCFFHHIYTLTIFFCTIYPFDEFPNSPYTLDVLKNTSTYPYN